MKYLARSFKIQRKRFLENTFIVMNPFALQGPGDLTDLGSTREECIRSCGTKLICFNQIIVLPSPSSYYSTPSLEQKEFKICSYSENQKIIALFFFRIMKCGCRSYNMHHNIHQGEIFLVFTAFCTPGFRPA